MNIILLYSFLSNIIGLILIPLIENNTSLFLLTFIVFVVPSFIISVIVWKNKIDDFQHIAKISGFVSSIYGLLFVITVLYIDYYTSLDQEFLTLMQFIRTIAIIVLYVLIHVGYSMILSIMMKRKKLTSNI